MSFKEKKAKIIVTEPKKDEDEVINNFIFMYGTQPSKIVHKDTKMIEEVANIILKKYDKKLFGLRIPRCFDDLMRVEANFEIT